MKNRSLKLSKKVIVTLVALTIGILAYTSALDVIVKKAGVAQLDDRANAYFDRSIKNAALTFAAARALNAVISVFQDTEIQITPVGVGVTLAIGEILDPLNDMIERFSWVMLISTTSLGIQKVLMAVADWFGFKVLMCFSALFILIGVWVPKISHYSLLSLGFKLLLISFVIRFCLPVTAVATDKIYGLFLEEEYLESTKSLNKAKEEVKESELLNRNMEDDPDSQGFWDGLKQKYQNVKDAVNLTQQFARLKDIASNIIKYIINLIIVFVLQTIIIPLLILWGLIKLTGHIFGGNISTAIEQRLKDLILKKERNIHKVDENSTLQPSG